MTEACIPIPPLGKDKISDLDRVKETVAQLAQQLGLFSEDQHRNSSLGTQVVPVQPSPSLGEVS